MGKILARLWELIGRFASVCVISAVLLACDNSEDAHQHHAEHGAHSEPAALDGRGVENEQGLSARGAYLRQPAPGQPVVAAFVVLKNASEHAYILRQVSSPRATSVEIHQSSHQDGKMVMRPVKDLEIPPQSEISLEPGSYHLMLSGIEGRIESGEQIPLRFDFGDDVALDVTADVRTIK